MVFKLSLHLWKQSISHGSSVLLGAPSGDECAPTLGHLAPSPPLSPPCMGAISVKVQPIGRFLPRRHTSERWAMFTDCQQGEQHVPSSGFLLISCSSQRLVQRRAPSSYGYKEMLQSSFTLLVFRTQQPNFPLLLSVKTFLVLMSLPST